MKIALFSDLHLEHRGNPDYIVEHVLSTIPTDVNLIVNAGDTHHDYEVRMSLQDKCKVMFPDATYVSVFGNHCLYGNDWGLGQGYGAHELGDVRILSASLWTDFDQDWAAMRTAMDFINDFRLIMNVDGEKMVQRFASTLQSIEHHKPQVVVTHFAPSKGSIHPRWEGQPLNSYFCPDAIGKLKHRPALWLHGHIHDPVDYHVEGVRVVANPLGYPGETYRRDITDYAVKIIEV